MHKKLTTKPTILSSAYYLDDFMFWEKSSARELMKFVSREVVERVRNGKSSILHQGYLCHAYVRYDDLACAIICDEEYPENIVYSLISEIIIRFLEKGYEWSSVTEDVEFEFPFIQDKISDWQDSTKVDKLQQIQKDIELTKETVIKTIDQLLERGEKLETLASRSDDLSYNSRIFLDKSKEMNSCCNIL
jgi:synaptobrevin family protein YKT6